MIDAGHAIVAAVFRAAVFRAVFEGDSDGQCLLAVVDVASQANASHHLSNITFPNAQQQGWTGLQQHQLNAASTRGSRQVVEILPTQTAKGKAVAQLS